ncbi:MAG: hypothetical protein ACXWQR_20770 [Ktedonobacterales bacterium]
MQSITHAPSEEVAAQLRDLERQGGGMARFAHWSAGALLVAFSLGSLLSISHAAFITFLAEWNAGRFDIPDGISLVVNVLLVLACDVGLLYAASVLRVLIASEAPKSELRVHKWAMIGASVLESSTYLYLAWEFDRPSTVFLWLIMIARAVAAPLFAAYLSMARPLPVGPGDVAYHASLASGKGVVHDVATLAADPDASLARKVRIYRAAARMAPHDRTRFDAIVEAVSVPDAVDMPTTPSGEPAPLQSAVETPTRPPTGGGSPIAQPVRTPRRKVAPVLRLEPPQEGRKVAAQASAKGVRTRVPVANYEPQARAAWAEGARSVAKMERATGMSHSAAQSWVRSLKAEAAAMASQSSSQVAQ